MFLVILALIPVIGFYFYIEKENAKEYQEFKKKVFEEEFGIDISFCDDYIDQIVYVKSYQEFKNYNEISFLMRDKQLIKKADIFNLVEKAFDEKINEKIEKIKFFKNFLKSNKYKSNHLYYQLEEDMKQIIKDINDNEYKVMILCISPSNIKELEFKRITLIKETVENFKEKPYLFLNKAEYNEILKEIKIEYETLKTEVLKELRLDSLDIVPYYDVPEVIVKSRQTFENFDDIKYFKQNKEMLEEAEKIIKKKNKIENILKNFLKDNKYESNPQYYKLKRKMDRVLRKAEAFRVKVDYISSAGNHLDSKVIELTKEQITEYKKDPILFMSKTEYNKLIKEEQKKFLTQKQQVYYEIINNIIDYANTNKDFLIIKESHKELDELIGQLFDRTINSIKKIKSVDSEEWDFIKNFVTNLKKDIEKIIKKNQRILKYYESTDFLKIKKICEALMNSQREFNEYINEKVQSISKLFGTRVVRNETVVEDEYNYIRPYKKTVTPFTAEVSSTVFASAENNPLEYIIKYFYPNKRLYPEQIQKLYQLVEELETLKEAKQIIENYKLEYQQFLGNVPNFIMENDEAGFYSRLGFATIDESTLTVEYKFSYTSNGGLVQRSFTVPMKEETIEELIKALENKLTMNAFVKEQRTLMTKKLRDFIKERDNFTCCNCGNSTHIEPNLLLEIDHIIPVSKGGETKEENLQTLCWKCNRSKSNRI